MDYSRNLGIRIIRDPTEESWCPIRLEDTKGVQMKRKKKKQIIRGGLGKE